MTNSEAQAYAVVGLRNLIDAGLIKVKNKKEVLRELDSEMYYLMDSFSEDVIVKIAEREFTKED